MTKDSLQELAAKIDAARQSGQKPDHSLNTNKTGEALSLGIRIALEFICAVGVGGGVGYTLDRATGTLPLFLIFGVFFGAAAGFLTILRSTGMIRPRKNRK